MATAHFHAPRWRCCDASACRMAGSAPLWRALRRARRAAGLSAVQLPIKRVGCLRLCSEGPLLALDGGAVSADPAAGRATRLYGRLTPELAADLLMEALAGAVPALEPHRLDPHLPFFALQRSVVLEHCGVLDPGAIDDALAHGAYAQLRHCRRRLSPAAVRAIVRLSGLRGRGGAGFPTGLKWDTVAQQPPGPRLLVCNADEGDPGAFMNRSVLEGDPHRLVEGMAIAAYAVGAERGYIYVRAEYPLAIRRLRVALAQARRRGLLGDGQASDPMALRLELRVGAGAYVCGEETALLRSIEGRRGVPHPRPPYPAEVGLGGAPTLINNVETFAAVPSILRHGAAWYGAIGSPASPGTKVFALSGALRHTGLVEVPLGTPLRQVVETMGGGGSEGWPIKAVQTGGPSGGCVPASQLDVPLDDDHLRSLGARIGSGGLVVIGPTTSMPALARQFMRFSRQESCGQCLPCRAGTVQLEQLLDRFVGGVASRADVERFEALAAMVQRTSLCGLGQAAPTPALSSLRWFRQEYLDACMATETPWS